jgi:hypothetical protein
MNGDLNKNRPLFPPQLSTFIVTTGTTGTTSIFLVLNLKWMFIDQEKPCFLPCCTCGG